MIIGRCSNFILDVSEYHNVLRVFVHASWDFRVKEAMKKMSGSQKEVEKLLMKTLSNSSRLVSNKVKPKEKFK